MIACDNPGCPIEWFHFECMGLVDAPSRKRLNFTLNVLFNIFKPTTVQKCSIVPSLSQDFPQGLEVLVWFDQGLCQIPLPVPGPGGGGGWGFQLTSA